MAEKRLLIITKDSTASLVLKRIALKQAYAFIEVQVIHEIQTTYAFFKPSLVTLDLDFGDMDSVALLNYLCNIQCKAPVILIGTQDERLLLAIKHIGEIKGLKIAGILQKPPQDRDVEKILLFLGKKFPTIVDSIKIAKALEEKQFLIYYQPKIATKTKKLCGLEALVRWQLPKGEIISPLEFIPIAEESGLIMPLTHWIIRKVFEDCREFQKTRPMIQFSINLSPSILSDVVFPDEISKLVKKINILPQNICFEVTESGVSHQSELILEVLTRLRIMGFSLSIDDFGTGYSSIAELLRLPFTELKVDKSFVLDMMDNTYTKTIVSSTIDLGHHLGLELVAEGVETQEIMDTLQDLNCDITQGYLISKPLCMAELEKWYDQHIDNDLTWHKNKTGT